MGLKIPVHSRQFHSSFIGCCGICVSVHWLIVVCVDIWMFPILFITEDIPPKGHLLMNLIEKPSQQVTTDTNNTDTLLLLPPSSLPPPLLPSFHPPILPSCPLPSSSPSSLLPSCPLPSFPFSPPSFFPSSPPSSSGKREKGRRRAMKDPGMFGSSVTLKWSSYFFHAMVFILCDVMIFLVRLQGKFKIDHSLEWKVLCALLIVELIECTCWSTFIPGSERVIWRLV